MKICRGRKTTGGLFQVSLKCTRVLLSMDGIYEKVTFSVWYEFGLPVGASLKNTL